MSDGPGVPIETRTADPEPPRPANALTVPAFRYLWLNNVAFFLVMNAQRFAYGWLVLDGLNRNEGVQGLVVFTLGIPTAFIVLYAGALADRVDRKKLLVVTQIAGGVVMLATAILLETGTETLVLVIVSTLLAGSAVAFGQPVRASLVPALVARDQLFSAIAVNALAMTASMIFGPVVLQLVGDRFGFDGAFWFLTALLAVGLLFLIPLRVPPLEARPEERSVVADTAEAIGHVRRDRSIRKLFGLLILASLTVNPAVMVTLQAFVKEELGRDGGDAAPLFALMGVGLAISSAIVMRKGDMKNKGAAFMRAMIVGSSMTFLMGQATEYRQLLPLVFVMGLAGGFYINMNQGLIQAHTPQAMMGRVMGLYTLIQAGFLPIGALVMGGIASQLGVGTTISAAAAIAFVGVVVTYASDSHLRHLS